MLSAVGLSTHIYNNHVKSVLLLLGFPFLLVMMVGAFTGGMTLFGQPPGVHDLHVAGQAAVDGILAYGHIAIGAAAAWMVIAFFFHGSMMRMATGSRPVTREQMPELYNVLENLCIQRGMKMPQFEIIDSAALNAFATGINDRTYKIVLTRGIVEALDRDELEGVIAHELTHIINRDVRLLIIAVIFAGMISFFAEMLFRSMSRVRFSSGNSRNKGGGLIVLLLALAILMVGYLFAILIRFALSRKREFLADAGAIEMTKNPEAMMRALMKISGHDRIQGMPDEVEQMCIENSRAFMGLFATHPPIDQRIAVIAQMTRTPMPQAAAMMIAQRRPAPPIKKKGLSPWA